MKTRLNRDVKAWLQQPIITQMLLTNIYQQQGKTFTSGDTFSLSCYVDSEDFFYVTVENDVVIKVPNVFTRPNGTVSLEVWREITVDSQQHPEKAKIAQSYLEMFQKTIFDNLNESTGSFFFEWSDKENKFVLQSPDGTVTLFSTEVVPDALSDFLINSYLSVKVQIVTAIGGKIIE